MNKNSLMEAREQENANFHLLCDKLDRYGYEQSTQNEQDLFLVAESFRHRSFPLPSGKWGNSLAVALEMHMYVGALYLIQNAEHLAIDLNFVSSQYDGTDICNAQQVFEFSQANFDNQKISEDDAIYQEYPNDRRYHNTNVDASLEVATLLKSKTKIISK